MTLRFVDAMRHTKRKWPILRIGHFHKYLNFLTFLKPASDSDRRLYTRLDDAADMPATSSGSPISCSVGVISGAMRILREEVLPALARFGAARDMALTRRMIADILFERGATKLSNHEG